MATTKKLIDSAGATLASEPFVTATVQAAREEINNKIDQDDYLNNNPKVGFDPGYNEALINSDFKYSLGAAGTNSFSFMDRDGRQVIYYGTTTPTGFVSVFRAYRNGTTEKFIFDNDPVSLTFLNPNERLQSFSNVGTHFILARLVSTVAPLATTRHVLIKTGGSSLWTDWSFGYDVTSLMATLCNLYLLQDNGTDYILRVSGPSNSILTVYDSSLTLLRSQQLINNAVDLDLTDRSGLGRTGLSVLSASYFGGGVTHPFTWNPFTETLHQRNSAYSVYKTPEGLNVGLSFTYSISWNIPKSWITSGAGTPTNMIPIKNGTYRYRLYPDATWGTDDGGVAQGDSGSATSIVTDDYNGQMHVMVRSTQGTTSGGSGNILAYVPGNPRKTYSSNLFAGRSLVGFSLPIPDGSAYAKSIYCAGALLIGEYMLFVGNSNAGGTRQMLTKYSVDDFDSVVRENDTLVLNSATTNIDPFVNAPAFVKSKGTNLRFNTTVVAGVPTYSVLEPGQPVLKAGMVGSELRFTDTGISFPAIPTTIDGKTNFVSHGQYAWNGNVSAPVFYALIKTTTYLYVAKCTNGVWSIPGEMIGKTTIDSGNASRGDTRYTASVAVKNNILTESGKYYCEFVMPVTGNSTNHLITYDTKTDTGVVYSPNQFSTAMPVTNMYNYIEPIGYYEPTGSYTYNERFGYIAFRAPLALTSVRILSSKDVRGAGAQISEEQWFSYGNLRHEIVVTATSSVGLIAYISEYPVFIGGYYAKIPGKAVSLLPSTDNYIYAVKSNTGRTGVDILVSTVKTTNSFSKICLAKITTDHEKIISSYVYSIDGSGLPDQEGKDGCVLRSNGKTSYWGPFNGDELKKENLLLLTEVFSLAANASVSRNVATALGANATDYDLRTIGVELFVVDTEVGSPTNGYYVRADSIAAIGFKTTGEVLIQNLYSTTLNFLLRLRVTKKADK